MSIIQWIGFFIIIIALCKVIEIVINAKIVTPCPSTISKYDHKAARATMAKQDVEEHLAIAGKQLDQALKGKRINCAGVECTYSLYLINMFRCYFCGAYFCAKCARAHFGERT